MNPIEEYLQHHLDAGLRQMDQINLAIAAIVVVLAMVWGLYELLVPKSTSTSSAGDANDALSATTHKNTEGDQR